jgi:hypothetical protein
MPSFYSQGLRFTRRYQTISPVKLHNPYLRLMTNAATAGKTGRFTRLRQYKNFGKISKVWRFNKTADVWPDSRCHRPSATKRPGFIKFVTLARGQSITLTHLLRLN